MSSLVDFKFSSIRDDGNTTTVVVTYYAGDVTTENELDVKSKTLTPITRYRRTRVIKREELKFPRGTDYINEIKNKLKAEGTKINKTPIKEQNV